MKKLILVFLTALIFVTVSCGSSKNGKSDIETDTDDSVSDGDTADTGIQDDDDTVVTEIPDDGDSATDTASEQNDDAADSVTDTDNGDSQSDEEGNSQVDDDADTEPVDPCESDPCAEIAHSDGKCTVETEETFSCGCKTNYEWKNSACETIFPECSAESGTPCFDSVTGLIWSEKSADPMDWEKAVEYCEKLEEGGFSDWRLPTIAVLDTLVQNCYDEPYGSRECEERTDGYYSKFGDSGILWSASEDGEAYVVDFSTAYIDMIGFNGKYEVRCVRIESETKPACETLPKNAEWNTTAEITQTWDWDKAEWTPNVPVYYGDEPSAENCAFKCMDGYVWEPGAGKCFRRCSPESEFPCIDDYEGWMWSSANVSYAGISFDEAKNYCETLEEGGYSDWELPTVSQLRTLIQNCPKTVPGGTCSVTDSCVSEEQCWSIEACSDACEEDMDGKYSKFGDWKCFYSSSLATDTSYASEVVWYVCFHSASIDNGAIDYGHMNARCVRMPEH